MIGNYSYTGAMVRAADLEDDMKHPGMIREFLKDALGAVFGAAFMWGALVFGFGMGW